MRSTAADKSSRRANGGAVSDPRNTPDYADSEDPVTHPSHYTYGSVECIDVIWEMGLGEGFCVGNAIKYLWRRGHKGKPVEDVRKARFYLDYYLANVEGEDVST